jgi:hypothetical protein
MARDSSINLLLPTASEQWAQPLHPGNRSDPSDASAVGGPPAVSSSRHDRDRGLEEAGGPLNHVSIRHRQPHSGRARRTGRTGNERALPLQQTGKPMQVVRCNGREVWCRHSEHMFAGTPDGSMSKVTGGAGFAPASLGPKPRILLLDDPPKVLSEEDRCVTDKWHACQSRVSFLRPDGTLVIPCPSHSRL